jgi:adenylosuccinate lyase
MAAVWDHQAVDHQAGALPQHSPLAQAGLALGPLDGRYRAAVAPLVEHLSEGALNRERVRVEVEWVVHLAALEAVPGVRPLTRDERAGLRRLADDFGTTRWPSWLRSNARPCTTSRPSSTTSNAG